MKRILAGSSMGMAAALAAAGVLSLIEPPPRPALRAQRSQVRPRIHKRSDRGKKQFLLKGIRP